LYFVINVVKRFGGALIILQNQKVESFFALNLAKHYGGIKFIQGLIILFGQEENPLGEEFWKDPTERSFVFVAPLLIKGFSQFITKTLIERTIMLII